MKNFYGCVFLFSFIVGVLSDKSVTVGDITTKVKGQSGKIAIYRGTNESEGVTVTFDEIKEYDANNETIKSSSHTYNNFAQLDFTFSELENTTYMDTNVSVTQFSFKATIPVDGVDATLTSYVYMFTEDGNITVDGSDFPVKEGEMKFNVKIEEWNFCSPCQHGNTNVDGAFLDFAVEIKGKKAPSSKGSDGKTYDLGNGTTVVIPTEVIYDNTTTKNMTDGYPKLVTKGAKSQFIFRFEKFETSVLYDPTVDLGGEEDNGSDDGGETPTTTEKQVEAAGIVAKVLGQSGKIEIMNSGSTGDSSGNRIVINFDGLFEKISDGDKVRDNQHTFNTFASQDFTFSDVVDETYPGTSIGVKRFTFESTLTNSANVKVYMYAFKSDGEITQENETTEVKAGNIKFNVEIMNWKFCGDSGVTCNPADTGEYLDFDIEIKGKGTAKKEQQESGKPVEVELGSGKAMLSRKIQIDGATDLVDMADGYPMIDSTGNKQIFRFRFPKFTNKVVYDPLCSLFSDSGSGTLKVGISTLIVAIVSLLLQNL